MVLSLLALLFATALAAYDDPIYTAGSIVNAADNQLGPLAPNTIVSIYGQNLAYGTEAVTSSDIPGGVLPTALGQTGVRVLIGGLPGSLYYVSPTQINFLIPAALLPVKVNLQLVIDGLAGPSIPLQLASASPALFQLDLKTALATIADGSVVTEAAPAQPGEIVILWATGLGETNPPVISGVISTQAAPLTDIGKFSVVLNGKAVDPADIYYAGIAPDFAGLYQINVRLPASTAADPQIQIGLDDSLSPPGILLPVKP